MTSMDDRLCSHRNGIDVNCDECQRQYVLAQENANLRAEVQRLRGDALACDSCRARLVVEIRELIGAL